MYRKPEPWITGTPLGSRGRATHRDHRNRKLDRSSPSPRSCCTLQNGIDRRFLRTPAISRQGQCGSNRANARPRIWTRQVHELPVPTSARHQMSAGRAGAATCSANVRYAWLRFPSVPPSRAASCLAVPDQFAPKAGPAGGARRMASAGGLNLRGGRYNLDGRKPACPRRIHRTSRCDALVRTRARSTGTASPPGTQCQEQGRNTRPKRLRRK